MSSQLLNSSLTFYIGLTVLLQLISISSCQSSFSSDDCTTPSGQIGQCVNIRQCPSVISILNNAPKPLSQNTRQTLAALGCGFEGRDPKVCCSTTLAARPLRDPAQPYPYYSEVPPAVDRHPNERLLPEDCGRVLPQTYVFGGNRSRLYEFPWMTLLSYQTPTGRKFKCGGSVLNERYILTAAHCLTNLGNDVLIGVRVGEDDISQEIDCGNCPPTQDITIAESITHPQYEGFRAQGQSSKMQHDIGLIRLASPIDLSQRNVKPVCIPRLKIHREKPLNNTYLEVTGWGFTEEGTTSPYLLKANLPYVSNEQCGQLLNRSVADGVGFRQLCAGGVQGIDACGGDSGGPLQLKEIFGGRQSYVQYGIVSFGPRRCGQLGVPGVYTRVSHYVKWVLDTIRQ